MTPALIPSKKRENKPKYINAEYIEQKSKETTITEKSTVEVKTFNCSPS